MIIKRLFDVMFAIIVLIVTSPFILLGAIAIKLDSPGPVFYRAKRAGLGGRPFMMFKLRTMRTGLDAVDKRVTAENDNRITRSGHWLRKTKLDEFPQFWNVLIGDMSVVGPRPEDWDIVQNHYTEQQMRTLKVRPGIASYAEVMWYPDLTYHDPPPPNVPIQTWYIERHMPAQLNESLRYINERTFWLDMWVLLQTAYCVVVFSFFAPKKRPLSSTATKPITEVN